MQKEIILFGKYQILRELGRGQAGIVYLARHISLDALRAIKCISKTNERYNTFQKEAHILKSLHHSGIPVIFDIEEDDSTAYIIEEYLQGESITSLVERLGSISKQMLIHYGIQLCQVIYYLHSAKPTPIIHLDLKPNNLIISNGIIKLLDFGNAESVSEANTSSKRYGTVGCAAPEQYTGESIDERTDIYAIGVILYYLGSCQYPGVTPSFSFEVFDLQLKQIISCCLEPNIQNRYQSVGILCEKLEKLQAIDEKFSRSFQTSSLNVAVLGSKPGVGTTHFALGLVNYINKRGIPCIYKEHNNSGAIISLSRYDPKAKEQSGIYLKNGCPLVPLYSDHVLLDLSSYPIHILDFGCKVSRMEDEMENIDLVLLIAGVKTWELGALDRMLGCLNHFKHTLIVLNYETKKISKSLSKSGRFTAVVKMPCYPNPWMQNSVIMDFYQSIMKQILPQGRGVDKLREVPSGIFGRKTSK